MHGGTNRVCSVHNREYLQRRAGDDIGQYVQLITDAAESDSAAELVVALDAAVPLWAEKLRIAPEQLVNFHAQAYCFASRERMLQAGVLPERLPVFLHGLQRGNRMWVIREPTAYATRHLFLHEGAHALMYWAYQGAGAGWFSEGSAELLATHRWENGRMEVAIVPRSRDAAPYWGRIGIIEKARREGKVPAIEQLLDFRSSPVADVDQYAWAWAWMAMLDAYPEYRQVWTEALSYATQSPNAFNAEFMSRLQPGGEELRQRWRLWVWSIDYGMDPANEILPGLRGQNQTTSTKLSVCSERSWMPAVIGVDAGTLLHVTATGSAVLDTQPKPWRSEPAGITVDYSGGRPLGELQALVLDAPASDGVWTRAPQVTSVGEAGDVEFPQGGTLLLRINDRVDGRENNRGCYQVEVGLGAEAGR